jgi:hypothetical protein
VDFGITVFNRSVPVLVLGKCLESKKGDELAKSKIGCCKFCGVNGNLSKSHIIPTGFISEKHFLASSYQGEFQQKSFTGVWDRFLCNDHESQFGIWDDYAIQLFRDRDPIRISKDFFIYKSVNYDLLKLFFISVLWRADAAAHQFFDNINLYKHRDILKSHIENKDPGGLHDYSVMLCYSDEIEATGIIAPRIIRHMDIDFVLLYLPRFTAIIKVDERPLPDKFRDKALNDSGKLYLEKRVFRGSIDEQIMQKVVIQNFKRKTTTYDPENSI